MTDTSVFRRNSSVALLAFAGLTALTALLAARVVEQGKAPPWYRALRKPKHAPPDPVFSVVSTGLFVLSAVSGWRVWNQPASPQRTRALALWGTQLALNVNWTRLFFGRHKARAAFADLLALWATLGAYMMQTRTVDRTASHLMAPYLGWVTYAGYLNEEILRKNRKLLLN